MQEAASIPLPQGSESLFYGPSMVIPASSARSCEWNGKRAQVQHRLRWARQCLSPPQVGVIGGYHLGNLGDMALGHAVQRRVAASGLSCGLQTIYNLERWPATKLAVVGGGAVGYEDCLLRLKERYGRHPDRVAILGVDFNDPSALAAHRDFLKNVTAITCRSQRQAAELSQSLGREDIVSHPDLCFSLKAANGHSQPKNSDISRIFGVNCLPLLVRRTGREFVAGTDFMAEMKLRQPHWIPHIEQLSAGYRALVRQVCIRACSAGFRVRHFAFTPDDDLYARIVLCGLDVEFLPYTANMDAVMSQMARCERFFTSRFHSLVFSLLQDCRITAFCYAPKCLELLDDLKIKHPSILGIEDLFQNPEELANRVFDAPGLRVADDVVAEACGKVTSVVDSVVERLQGLL